MPDWVDRQIDRLGGWLLPPRCVLCGARGQAPCLDLCAGCAACFEVADAAVLAGPEPVRRSCAPFAYAWPLDHLVQALKYRGQLATARVLGNLLADWVTRRGLQHDIDLIVPVPLHPARHAERGFNQAGEIARRLGRGLSLPVRESAAVRRRATPSQVGLPLVERRNNVAGAFDARNVEGLRVAIVDDVTTTGATLQELAGALHRAGATTVDAWCVARAERRIRCDAPREPSPAAGRMR